MNTFNLKIIASDKVFYEGKCKFLLIPISDGQMGIMANHENMVVAVNNGNMRYEFEDGKNQDAVVSPGFVQIIDNNVILLVHSVERPEEIDINRAKEAKERAEEQLRQKQSKLEYHHSKASLARAMARMKATKKF